MSTETRMTMKDFIKKYHLEYEVETAYSNPNMPDSKDMDHYTVTIYIGNRYANPAMDVTFSMGRAIGREPELDEVLDCIASDSAGYDNASSFEDWARDYGYDTDSRKAERVYDSVSDQRYELFTFLGFAGENAYEELLFETEKL